MIKRYSELKQLKTLMARYEYLRCKGDIGRETFGFDRYLNQQLYNSQMWKSARQHVIIRDNGCDLGVEGYELDKIVVHHMNPITIEDVIYLRDIIFDPEFLICCSHRTHEAIHFGDASLLPKDPVIRTPGDTKLW